MRSAAEQWAEVTAFAQKHVVIKHMDGDRVPDHDVTSAFGCTLDIGTLSITGVRNAVRKAVLPLIQERDSRQAQK